MKVSKIGNGMITIEMTEEEAERLDFVAQDAVDLYHDVEEDTGEDPEVSGHAGLVAEMLDSLHENLEKAGIQG